MDIPDSSRDGTGGSSSRPTTRYGTIKCDSKEVSNRLCGDDPGHDTVRNRSRSTSPRHCFHRAGSNDRVDLIASADHNMSPRTSNYTSKLFAFGNCCSEKIYLNSHTDQTHNSFNNYKLDDFTQGIYSQVYLAPAREGSEGSGATLDFGVQVPNWVKSEGIGEQRGLRSSADDYAVNGNRFMAHCSSGMSISELRGTTVLGANIEGSITYTGSQLLTQDGISKEPGVLNTVKSEASSSGQCPRSSEQISSLTDILTRLVEEIKLLPELFAALSATNALEILQTFVAGSAGPDAPAASSRQLDLVIDSLNLISEKQAKVASSLKLPHGADPGGVGLYRTDCRNVELNLDSLPSGEKDRFADCYNKEPNLSISGVIKERNDESKLVNNEVAGKDGQKMENTDGNSLYAFKLALTDSLPSGEKDRFADCYNKEPNLSISGVIKERNDESKLVNNEVAGKDGQKMENTDGNSLYAFKLALTDFVKELLTPTYIRGQIDKVVYKAIVRRVVKKVTSSVQNIPQTQENIKKYLSTFRPKILKLIKEYLKIFKKEKASLA